MAESPTETFHSRLSNILLGIHTLRTKFANGQYQLLIEENVRDLGFDHWATELMSHFTDAAVDLLAKPKPPTLAEFPSLKRVKPSAFAAYLVLATTTSKPQLYSGSGTHKRYGFNSRQTNYDRLEPSCM